MHTRLSSPAQTQFRFPARRYSRSRLNPQARYGSVLSAPSEKRISSSDESIRIHLSNLDKLIQKNTQPVLPDKTSKAATKKGLSLEGFDLGKILWRKAAAAAEEMSPRHLNRLQRLLSNNSLEYSPRNNLGNRWREYHGSKDWVGLLDPLDENLRREVVRYGEFIQAAYQAFNNQPSVTDDGTSSSSSSSETAPPFQVTLLDKSYKVTKNLYSTSSIHPPDWIDDMAPNLGWLTQRSSWIGYVAACDDQKEIARMGRRDIVIALRGTSTCLEWAENLRDGLIELPDHPSTDSIEPHKLEAKVECGFLSLYKTPGSDSPSLSESLMMEVQRLVQLYKGETLSISVTGHSLGAALAVLAGDELSNISTTHNIPLAVFSFGGPRVGNKGFANRITQNQVKVLRVVNAQDLITRVPGMLFNETLDEKLKTTGLVHDVPWAYSHVGSELRVDTKMSPYLKPNADVACCHDLEAYLHLVDGFSASDSPFRSNAKRSLLTLLSQQGSNVKKLYTSKVPAQKLNSRFMT